MPKRPSRQSTRVARLRRRVLPPASVREIRMPSRRTAIAPTVERILRAARSAGLAPEQRMDLAVAIAEALSNAVVHGNQQRAGTHVAIRVTVVPGRRATVDVRDSGTGFDHTSLRDPTDPTHLLTPGGRGVFLMRRLVDRLVVKPPGNHVTLTMRTRS